MLCRNTSCGFSPLARRHLFRASYSRPTVNKSLSHACPRQTVIASRHKCSFSCPADANSDKIYICRCTFSSSGVKTYSLKSKRRLTKRARGLSLKIEGNSIVFYVYSTCPYSLSKCYKSNDQDIALITTHRATEQAASAFKAIDILDVGPTRPLLRYYYSWDLNPCLYDQSKFMLDIASVLMTSTK